MKKALISTKNSHGLGLLGVNLSERKTLNINVWQLLNTFSNKIQILRKTDIILTEERSGLEVLLGTTQWKPQMEFYDIRN